MFLKILFIWFFFNICIRVFKFSNGYNKNVDIADDNDPDKLCYKISTISFSVRTSEMDCDTLIYLKFNRNKIKFFSDDVIQFLNLTNYIII